MVQKCLPSKNDFNLVLYQKIGENQNPVALRKITCRSIYEDVQKNTFHLNLEGMKDNRTGYIEGWIRARPVKKAKQVLGSRGGMDMSRSRSWQQQWQEGPEFSSMMSTSASMSNTQSLYSVDMSIDLTNVIP